jgi:hypothetical protein
MGASWRGREEEREGLASLSVSREDLLGRRPFLGETRETESLEGGERGVPGGSGEEGRGAFFVRGSLLVPSEEVLVELGRALGFLFRSELPESRDSDFPEFFVLALKV